MSKLSEESEALITQNRKIRERLEWLCSIKDDPVKHYDEVNAEFEALTSLKKEDYVFIFFCTALQCLRQYLVTDFKPRLSDKKAADAVKDGINERSFRRDNKYRMSVAQIWINPVPFDALAGGGKLKAGVSGANHRFTCPGHDPLLGYLFGTVNIMTGTITVINNGLLDKAKGFNGSLDSVFGLKNYHVQSLPQKITLRNGQVSERIVDTIAEEADSFSVLVDACVSRIKEDKEEGMLALTESLIKEHVHLKSDKRSKQSLPIPAISFLSPELAKKAASMGLDTLNVETVGKQAAYSFLINTIVSTLYWLYHQLVGDFTDFHKVRIRRILSVSNVLSSCSNLATILVGSLIDPKIMRKVDLGGTFVAFTELCRNNDYIYRMQTEYIENQLQERLNTCSYES